jgi:hypothetical protein
MDLSGAESYHTATMAARAELASSNPSWERGASSENFTAHRLVYAWPETHNRANAIVSTRGFDPKSIRHVGPGWGRRAASISAGDGPPPR